MTLMTMEGTVCLRLVTNSLPDVLASSCPWSQHACPSDLPPRNHCSKFSISRVPAAGTLACMLLLERILKSQGLRLRKAQDKEEGGRWSCLRFFKRERIAAGHGIF